MRAAQAGPDLWLDEPSQGDSMMVPAHSSDLDVAAALGLRTAFIPRPNENGPGQA
jgi:hypothetical protein